MFTYKNDCSNILQRNNVQYPTHKMYSIETILRSVVSKSLEIRIIIANYSLALVQNVLPSSAVYLNSRASTRHRDANLF
jgi:hypothetical protein